MKVLKIGAVWCSGCLVMKPRWKKIEEENPWLKTEYHDFDQAKNIVEKYNIDDKLPVFIFLNSNNEEVDRIVGEVSEEDILSLIDKHKNQ